MEASPSRLWHMSARADSVPVIALNWRASCMRKFLLACQTFLGGLVGHPERDSCDCPCRASPAIVTRPKQRVSSRIGRMTPSHRRLLQLEGLQQEIGTV